MHIDVSSQSGPRRAGACRTKRRVKLSAVSPETRDLVLVLDSSLFSERLAKISLRFENEDEDEDEHDNFVGAAIRPKVAALR